MMKSCEFGPPTIREAKLIAQIKQAVAKMNKEQLLYHRNEFRLARAEAMKDGEADTSIVHAIERLGSALMHSIGDLGRYEPYIACIAESSSIAFDIPNSCPEWHLPFCRLYDLVRNGRNDAVHQGARARHLTTHAIELALVLEDALMELAKMNTVGDYMVRDPICATLWQPISFIRQQMLVGSFSYFPLRKDEEWYLVSDRNLAAYLLPDRRQRLAQTIQEAISDGLQLEVASCCYTTDGIDHIIKANFMVPSLVCRKDCQGDLIGIITSFDIL